MNDFPHSAAFILCSWAWNWAKKEPKNHSQCFLQFLHVVHVTRTCGHACASFGDIPCHAYASVTCTRHLSSALGTHHLSSALGTRTRRPHARITASFSKLHFLAFLPLLNVSFPSSKPFLPYTA
ncbi:uncharacterized protein DS421_16g541710 [Arachis hypogaea]|nr:uncharacterized protein DS421_16g541710 [Arachis hypogaea]